MIKTKKDLKNVLKIEKKLCNPPRLPFLLMMFGASEKSIIWIYQKRLRKWEFYLNNKKRFFSVIYKFKTLRLGHKYGLSIMPNCFDAGLHIMHLGSILVNSNTRVGKNCTIHVNTAIVATGGISSSAVIGDDCKIGVGATLVGGISLGNHVVIGAGAVVTKSFKENHITLAGVPAKIISNKAVM